MHYTSSSMGFKRTSFLLLLGAFFIFSVTLFVSVTLADVQQEGGDSFNAFTGSLPGAVYLSGVGMDKAQQSITNSNGAAFIFWSDGTVDHVCKECTEQ